MRERLQKLVATAGIASRRGAEELIKQGRVTVNGRTAELGETADPETDAVLVDGMAIGLGRRLYLALNKPVGYVSSLRSTHGEETVLALVDLPQRVFPVGRLDKDTSGLLLLTNDGDWANLVTHPRYGIEKEYRALVRGMPPPQTLAQLRRGITLADGTRTAPASVELIGAADGRARLSITLVEGKKRQIRLMLSSAGYPVLTLERVRVGPVELNGLASGRWRYLQQEEVDNVRELARRGRPTRRGS